MAVAEVRGKKQKKLTWWRVEPVSPHNLEIDAAHGPFPWPCPKWPSSVARQKTIRLFVFPCMGRPLSQTQGRSFVITFQRWFFSLLICSGHKDEQLRKFERLNGELVSQITSLEKELHRAKNGLTDDDRTVADLKKKIAQLEKSLSKKSHSQSPVRITGATTKVREHKCIM